MPIFTTSFCDESFIRSQSVKGKKSGLRKMVGSLEKSKRWTKLDISRIRFFTKEVNIMTNKKNPISISGDLLPKGSQLTSSFNLPMTPPALSIIQQLNPLEHISNSIKTICYYKEQCKLIDLEIKRIEKDAEITMKKIDKLFLIEMEKLKSKRESAEMKLGMAANELSDHSVNRNELIKLISSLVSEICKPDISIEAKKIASDTIKDLRETLNSTNESSYLTLELLIKNINHDIDKAPLLEGC